MYNKAKNEELERQMRALERNVASLKEDLKEAEDKNKDLRMKIKTFEERIGSLSISFEEERKRDTERANSASSGKVDNVEYSNSKMKASKTLDRYMGAVRMYDEKIEHYVQILKNLLSERGNIERATINETRDAVFTSEAETDVRERRGPTIIENIQIVPPRRPLDSNSEVTSLGTQERNPHWTEVRRKKKKKTGETGSAGVVPSGPSTPRRPGVPAPGGGEPSRVRRAPRHAVVAIKIENGNSTYADILRKARENINIKELGIANPKFRKAANGGVLLEIPGPDGHQRAEILANRLRNEVGSQARITRPIKYGELCISGIDYSVTTEELVGALAAAGQCEAGLIRVGPFRDNIRGVRVVWAKCPLNSAIKLAELQNVEVGWSAVRIELLQTRPTQCFKCWDFGHLRSGCKANVDRQGCCFGCGSRDHNIKDCKVPPQCVICKDKGLPFTHRLGSVACGSLKFNRPTSDRNAVNNGRG